MPKTTRATKIRRRRSRWTARPAPFEIANQSQFTAPRLYTENVIPALLILLAASCSAQDLDAAARDLARRIARQDAASITIRNTSSLSPAEAANITRILEAELRVRPARPGASIVVTLSENVQQYLWIAEIRRGDEREVVMLPVPRQTAPAPTLAPVIIEKRLLWEQSKPIL